jgi:ribosomal-protein-alanine N-acetyltransferase
MELPGTVGELCRFQLPVDIQTPRQSSPLKGGIAYPYQGHGHATRAVGLAVEVMTIELGLHRAEAITQTENLGSQRVLRNNGFLPCGVFRSRIFTAGAWRDEILWERLLD